MNGKNSRFANSVSLPADYVCLPTPFNALFLSHSTYDPRQQRTNLQKSLSAAPVFTSSRNDGFYHTPANGVLFVSLVKRSRAENYASYCDTIRFQSLRDRTVLATKRHFTHFTTLHFLCTRK